MKNIYSLLKGNGLLLIVILILSALLALDGIISPYFIGRMTNEVLNLSYSEMNLLIVLWGVSLLILALVQLALGYFTGKLKTRINKGLKHHQLELAYQKRHLNDPSSNYVTTIFSEIKEIETNIVGSIPSLILCLLQGIITFVFLLKTNISLGIVFVLLGCLPAIVPKVTAKWLKAGTINWQAVNQKYAQMLDDALNGRKLVHRYQVIHVIYDRMESILGKTEQSYFKMNFRQKVSQSLVTVLYSFSIIGGFLYGIYLVYNNELTLGTLLMVYMAADRVISPLIFSISLINSISSNLPLLNKAMEKKSSTGEDDKPMTMFSAEKLIRFDKVSIGYDKPIIASLSFDIDRGDKVLIHGESGSGKSTLLKTILQELPVLSGDVLVSNTLFDGDIYHNIAVLDQNPFVFQDTLRFNLTLGRDLTDEQLMSALSKVGLTDFDLSDLNRPLGSEHRTLSNGELKRIELARALLFQKEILVVDEALSGLDRESADLIHDLILTYPGTLIDVEHHITEQQKASYSKLIKL